MPQNTQLKWQMGIIPKMFGLSVQQNAHIRKKKLDRFFDHSHNFSILCKSIKEFFYNLKTQV